MSVPSHHPSAQTPSGKCPSRAYITAIGSNQGDVLGSKSIQNLALPWHITFRFVLALPIDDSGMTSSGSEDEHLSLVAVGQSFQALLKRGGHTSTKGER